MIQSPQSFIIHEECQKVAWQNGYRRPLGESEGWARYGSTTAKGTVWLAAAGPSGPWFLGLDHSGVIEELGRSPSDMPGPGLARFSYGSLTDLYEIMPRVYQFGVTLPDGPLEEFRGAVRDLPMTTEAERMVIQRVGQNVFREALMIYWGGRCAVTGAAEPRLLRASHIKPWARCETDAERLDVFNGLLLAPNIDAAFDAGLVSFSDDGSILFAQRFRTDDRLALGFDDQMKLSRISPAHLPRLAWHREYLLSDGSGIADGL